MVGRGRIQPCLAAALAAAGAGVAFACGGTTGREGLTAVGPGTVDATVADSGDAGADSGLDAGDFDVPVLYADRALPDVEAPPEGGAADASAGLPACPPFLPVRGGQVVTIGERDQVPSVYAPDGSVTFAPDGSACASYGWLGSPAIDECVTGSGHTSGSGFIWLPPCNWCSEAGVALQGPGAGNQRYDLCMALYACIEKSGCGSNVGTCLCGTADPTTTCQKQPPGPCATEEMAALEELSTSVQDALLNYTALGSGFLGNCGSTLNYVYVSGQNSGCFPDAGGD